MGQLSLVQTEKAVSAKTASNTNMYPPQQYTLDAKCP